MLISYWPIKLGRKYYFMGVEIWIQRSNLKPNPKSVPAFNRNILISMVSIWIDPEGFQIYLSHSTDHGEGMEGRKRKTSTGGIP